MFTITSRGLLRIFAVLGGCALLGVFVGSTFKFSRKPRGQQSTASMPPVQSKTSAIKILEGKTVAFGKSPILMLKIQNVSSKDIKALTISIGKTFMSRNYLFSDESIPPGATRTERISLPAKIEQEVSNSPEADRAIVFTAVLYSDGTGDGNMPYLQLLKNQAAGAREQAKRILATLRRVSGGNQTEQGLAELEAEGLNLPTTNGISPDYEEGLRYARKVLLDQVREIKGKRDANDFEGAQNKQKKLLRIFQSVADLSANKKNGRDKKN